MKILFTADIHIKLGQKSVPVPWAKNRFTMLFEQMKTLATTKADIFIIGGDVFDRIPTMEELEVYYELIMSCSIPTLIYPGNHEALKKNTTFLSYLRGMTETINPLVKIIDDCYTDPTGTFDILPYNKLKDFDPKSLQSNLLFTHVRGEIPPHVKPEVDLAIFDKWDLVVAGDLHSYENSQRNILYPGSPVTVSFHRQKVKTGVLLIDTDTLSHDWITLNLPQLLRITVGVGEETPATDFDHTVYEMQGDMSELAGVDNSELVDRKIVRRVNDSALILSSDMSLEEEASEYLLYILTLEPTKVAEIIKELTNHGEKYNWE